MRFNIKYLIIVISLYFSQVVSAQKFDSTGTVFIVESSHSDIAWDHTIEEERAVRNRNILNALDFMKKDSSFKWTIECVLYFKNLIEDHPEREDQVISYLKQGRLDCGASYTQPMEDCMYNELLVRQMYFGKKWFEDAYPDVKLNMVMHQDGPLRGLQTQQVYSKSGVKYFKGSRIESPPFLKWFSPDGSYLLSSFQIGYWGRPNIDTAYIINHLSNFKNGYYNNRNLKTTMITWGHDYNDPRDFSNTIKLWNATRRNKNRPEVRYGTFTDVLREVDNTELNLPELHGTLPNWWVYENWPSHNKLMTLQRETAKKLTMAEIFHTIKAIHSGDFSDYPELPIKQAWGDVSYACHTLVPRVYPTFLKKYENAHLIADSEVNNAVRWLSDNVESGNNPYSIVVFNSLSWNRTDPVSVDISSLPFKNVLVLDQKKNIIPSQLSKDGKLVFVAKDVPAVGYKSFVLQEDSEGNTGSDAELYEDWDTPFETEHYKITPGNGGLKSIFDKEFNKELLNTEKWLGGEWVSYHTNARGASEYIDFEPKEELYFEKSSQHQPEWRCLESGPVYTLWETEKIVAAHCLQRLQIKAYRNYKRIDLEVIIEQNDSVVNREQRLMLPINSEKPKFFYEVPFGRVETGNSEPFVYIDKGIFSTNPTTIPSYPREVQNWIYTDGDEIGITIGTSVGVVSFKDIGTNPAMYPIISPILVANTVGLEGSLIQAGDFRMNFSITSHETGVDNGYKKGIQSQIPLLTVFKENQPKHKKSLPGSKSFLSIQNNNCILSTMKKAESSDDIIVRFYETEGKIVSNTVLSFSFEADRVFLSDMIERKGEKLELSSEGINIPTGNYAIETILIEN